MEENSLNAGRRFVFSCREALEAYYRWIDSCNEADLKTHFVQLAEVRDHFNRAMEKTELILKPKFD